MGRPMPINTLLALNTLQDLLHSDIHQLSETVSLTKTIVKSILNKAVKTNLVDAYGSGRDWNYILSSRIYAMKGRKTGYVQQSDIEEARHLKLIRKIAETNNFIPRTDAILLLHVPDN